MAEGRKIPYVIEMIPDTKPFEKVKEKLRKIDMGEMLTFSPEEAKKLKGLLTNMLKDVEGTAKGIGTKIGKDLAAGIGKAQIQQALDVDVDKLKRALTVVEQLTSVLSDGADSDSWLKNGKGLIDTIKKSEQSIGALQESLGKLEVKFDGVDAKIANTIQKFDELQTRFEAFANSGQKVAISPFDFEGVSEQADKEIKKINDKLQKVSDMSKKPSVKTTGNSKRSEVSQEIETIAISIEKTLDRISNLRKKVEMPGISLEEERQANMDLANAYIERATQYKKLIQIKKKAESYAIPIMSENDIEENLEGEFQNAQQEAKKIVDLLSSPGKAQGNKGGIGIGVILPSEDDIRTKINGIIDKLNKPSSLHKIKLEIDNVANVIEDKQVRPYGKNEGDDDANTTALVKKTEERLDRVAEAINKKLTTNKDSILEKTKAWRKQMLDQFKFNKGDFEFKFNNALVDELQSLFDEYGLRVNIDPTYLADQIKTVLEGSSVSLSSGSANIDPSAMASAVMAGVRAALVGEPPTVHTPVNSAQERIPDVTEQVATEIEQTAKHLDIAEEYVQDVVKKIKDVAKYATKHIGTDKDSEGAKATREFFSRIGGVVKDENGDVVQDENKKPIPILDLTVISQTEDDAVIAKMLEQALLKDGQLGKLTGSTVIDKLSKFKGSSSKTIPMFIDSLGEVFYMLQEDTESVDEWRRKKDSKEVFDWARGRAKAADALREVRSPIRQGKIPSTETIDKAITLMTAIGRNTDSLEVLKAAREKLGSQTDDASVKEFQGVASEFYKGSTRVFYDLKKQAEDTFKGTVYMQGSKKGVVKRQDINSYKQLAKIDDNAVLLDIRVSSSMNNVALGEVKSKYGDKPSLREEQRLMRGQRADYLVSPEYEKDILNREVNYGGFKPQGVESVQINIEASIESLKKRIAETVDIIPQLQKQINDLDEEVEIKRQEAKAAYEFAKSVRNNPNATDSEKRNARTREIKAEGAYFNVLSKQKDLTKQIDDLRESQVRKNNLIKQLELTEQYNTLLTKSLELEGSIVKMEKDGAPQKELQNRKEELDGIRTQLTEIVSKATEVGGLYQQSVGKEYSKEERKIYALQQLALIEDNLITARAQNNVVASRIKKKDKEIAEVDTWGLGAGIGKSALNQEKYRATAEFMNSEYVQALQEALREQTKTSIAAMEQYAREVFDEKVSNAMIKEGMNPFDQQQVSQFLETERGQQYSGDFSNQVDTYTKELWAQYDSHSRAVRDQALEKFKESMQVKDGILSYVSVIKDENGKWVNEVVEIAVRDALRERLVKTKEILEEQQTPIQENIVRLEADKKAAIKYGGVSEKELLSGDIIADQIRKEEKLAKLQADRATKLQEVIDLEQAGVPDSDASVKQAKKDLANTDEQIARYEMLIRNRQKLVDMRYDESKESTYTDEEKELHFTNQIVGYNQKIEDSLAKQEELRQKIAIASEEEKSQLQYALKQEEDKVAGWRGKVSNFEGKLHNIGTAKSEVASTKANETTGGLIGVIKEAIGEASVGSVDLMQITEILQKILEVLSGNGVVGGTARNSEMDAKLARIKELEAKQQLANEQKKTVETVKQVENAKKETAVASNVADSKAHKNVSKTQAYKDIQKSVDAFRTSELKADKEPLNAIKMALDELSKINDQNSQEYIEWQRKLGSALSAYGKKNGIENGRGYYDKVYAELEKNGVTVDPKLPITNKSGISGALVEKGLVTIKEKEAKAKQSEAKAEEKITEEKKEQEQIRFTRKEKKELNRLKSETKDYNPDATTGTGSEFGGFATENTLRSILEVLNKISTSGVPKSGTKTKAPTSSNANDPIPDEASDEVDELTAKIEKLKVKFADAMKVGYLGKKDTGLKDFEKQLKKIDKALAEGKSVEKLEQMRQKAIALGDVVNTTVSGNKRKYSGTTEMTAATRQRSNMEARGVLDDTSLKAVQDYNKAYSDLIAKHKQFATKGTLYDPENQKTLQNMAIQVKDLGKQLEKSVAESEQLKELVNNSGFYNGKQMSGQHMLSAEETQNIEASMKSYLQSLNLGNLEHVKFDHTHQKLTATIRTSNKTVADLEVKYNEATGALYAYQKAERESLTGVPAFLNGFKKKFNSIMQYLTMTMSIHRVLAELRKGVQYVREIDLALTELKKVTDETEETYDKFLDTAAKTGNRLGATISAVTEATATFAKLGYNMEQATEMAESAIVYKNVGDNIASTEDAANSIISTMKGFRLEASESMAIVDRFNEVGNKFAITSQGIGEALRLSASALSEGGNSLDESIGLITAANEVVNDPSSVGTALKTLTLRLRGSKTE